MELIPEFTYSATLKPPLEVGPGPFGNRMYFEVIEGRVEGERINGDVAEPKRVRVRGSPASGLGAEYKVYRVA
jgi:hypothetical protein